VNDLKKVIFSILALIVLIPGFLWSLHYKEDKAFMESLLLHRPIEISQIHSAKAGKAYESGTAVPKMDLKKIVDWLNDYPANKITEQPDFDWTASNSGVKAIINIELDSGYEIKILFVDGDSIYVTRNDVKRGMSISYSFLEKARELEHYFAEFLGE
jgi:hypothetical protein